MKQCKECGKEVSTAAKVCPHCGKKYPTGGLTLPAKIFLIIIALFAFGKIIGNMGGSGTSNESATKTAINSNSTIKEAPTEIWFYDESQDEMGRGTIKSATTKSINTLSFDFPYSGPQHGTLHLRRHPRYGKDVILAIERGQFLTGIDGCKVVVRFDDGKPQAFWGNGAADHSTTHIFISNYSKFLNNLVKAKKVRIESPFYQEGNQVLEFYVDGLKWETASSAEKGK